MSTTIRSAIALLLMLTLGSSSVWGQGPVVITTDTNGNGTIEDSEKKFYLIQTNAFQSFYIAPQANNTITTNNILGDYMLWYFLDAGKGNEGTANEIQYYYIVNNSTGKYIYNHNGDSRGIKIITSTEFSSLTDNNKEKCKFKIVVNNTNGEGFYNINVKASQTYYGLNKQNGSEANNNPIRLTNTQYINDVNSTWKFIPFNGTFTYPTPPFMPSNTDTKYYYEIHNVQKNTYYASTDATPDKVIFTNQPSESRAWYFKEASSDNWYKYYYIINPSTGGKYMYYEGNADNTIDQTDAVSVKVHTDNSANEDRYQFVVVQAARGDGASRVTCYAIIPKLLIDKLWTSSSLGYAQNEITDGLGMGIINSRTEVKNNNSIPNGAHWTFDVISFTTVCATPDITFSTTSGKATITTTTSWPSIYYTTDGTTPSSTNGTLYSGPFDLTAQTTINAIVTKEGYTNSEVATKTFYQVAKPTIQNNFPTSISIACATQGAIIYYTTDGNTPNTSSTQYTGPLTENLLGVTIRAIAVKDGMINSEESSITLESFPYAPTITENCDNTFSLSCENMPTATIYYTYTTDNSEPAEPVWGASETNLLYEYPVEFSAGMRVKAKSFMSETTYSTSSSSETFSQIHTLAPTIELDGNTINITANEDNCTIYYTTDNTDPTTALTPYDPNNKPTVDLSIDVHIRAIAVATGKKESCVVTEDRPGEPTLTVTDGDCTTTTFANRITITTIGVGRTLWYTITAGNNSVAPEDKNIYTQYTEPVSPSGLSGENEYYTVHAFVKSSDGLHSSSIVSISHQMKTPGKPTYTEPTGSSNKLEISGGAAGDIAVCTSSAGTVNVTLNSYGIGEYEIPNVSGTVTIAFKHGNWQTSCETVYTIPGAPATPTASQSTDNKLSLNCATEMAEIFYTICDNCTGFNDEGFDNPTRESQSYYAGCFNGITDGTKIKAIAYKGFRASGILEYTYHPENPNAPTLFVDGNTVQINSPEEGATVYYTVAYTTDGTIPADPADPTQAGSNPVSFSTDNATYDLTGNKIAVFLAYAEKGGHRSNVVRVETREGYSINSIERLNAIAGDASKRNKYWYITADFSAANYTSSVDFTGVLVGNNHTISGLTKPLFATATDAVIHDLNLKDININGSGNVGAIAQTATGNTRIYNCGILPTTTERDENNGKVTGFTGSTLSSSGGESKVGSIVGSLEGNARVINCFSYANITGGSYRGGIVGNNNVVTASKSSSINTMVMNCMFYGDINTTEGNPTSIAPIYGGTMIKNYYTNNNDKGLNNYNYFRFNSSYVSSITAYNCALGAEDKYLDRFEFFRHTLNSTRDLASWYVSGSVNSKEVYIAKWVVDKEIAPFPILKEDGIYPSVVNHDAANAPAIDADNVHRNEGRKLGTLTVYISDVSDWENKPSGATRSKSSIPLNITDKDTANYDFNYKKVQLPYYREVGTGNYTNNKVVTGWKIVDISGSGSTQGKFTEGSEISYDEQGKPITPYNFADRSTYAKDLYESDVTNGASGRIFNQGAYWEVPEGVTSITIEPYWANCVYLADANYDVTYNTSYNTEGQITYMGTRYNSDNTGTYEGQTVYTSFSAALEALAPSSSNTVYDKAIVLVGNYHKCFNSTSPCSDNKPLTVMSADLNEDNEPDFCFFYQHKDRLTITPIRFDFINIPAIALVMKASGSTQYPQPGIFCPKGWFEMTNTSLMRFNQFEYGKLSIKTISAPLILMGGIYEQFVSTQQSGNNPAGNTPYIHIGGNAWFNEFNNGCHTNTASKTPKTPISVSGGDFNKFYLSGIYSPNATTDKENAECYIDGGRFGEVAGAGMQLIDGDVTWFINGADIANFYGGGINPAKWIKGNISTTITNSWVTNFYGGPKFGEMTEGKTVKTSSSNCHFVKFYGAGYGGNAYNRIGTKDVYDQNNIDEATWNGYISSDYDRAYNATYGGISTFCEYEYIIRSNTINKVARFFVNYASLSLASTHGVTSELTDCIIEENFYGGGRLGAVDGDVSSTLTNCSVHGNIFGAGESATTPTIMVMPKSDFVVAPLYNNDAGVFNDDKVKFPTSVEYTWKHAASVSAGNEFKEVAATETTPAEHYILTTENLDGLGKVNGTATLTINGKSMIGTLNDSDKLVEGTGNVYGGGELSNVDNTVIEIDGRTKVLGNVYGGGKGQADNFTCDKAMVGIEGAGVDKVNYPDPTGYPDGRTSVTINNGTVEGSVYGGGEVGRVEMNTTVTIGDDTDDNSMPIINGSVFGGGKGVKTHGYSALVRGNPTVTVQGKSKVRGSVYGGGEIASVARYNVAKTNDEGAPYGVLKDMPYALKTNNSGFCTVTVRGNAEIGPETPNTEGNVFGAGKGILPEEYDYTSGEDGVEGYNIDAHKPKRMVLNAERTASIWQYFDNEDDYITFIKTLALASQTDVTIEGNAKVKGSVYGGSESGFVQFDTNVTVKGGTIGTAKANLPQGVTMGAVYGNVYGGGKGDAEHTGADQNYVDAGLVKGNTKVKIEGGTILHNIYGGGAYGTVGEFVYDATSGMPTARRTYTISEGENAGVHNTTGGNTEIYITGGEIGTDGDENGMIFGSSRGDVGAPGSIHDKLAWVYDTHVAIGDTTTNATVITSSPLIRGSIYGGGENGHNFRSSYVRINGGTIGITSGAPIGTYTSGGASYPYRGNVYGGGCGTDMYDNNTKYNPIAGIVQGNARINMTGGLVVHNMYGAGAMGSVGTATSGGVTTIDISGGTVGVSGTVGDGNVFGAARGAADATSNEYALVRDHTTVNISGGTVKGNVYGGGELGCVGRYKITSDMRNFYWTDETLTENQTTYPYNNTGVCNVTITGGEIGTENGTTTNHISGHVFGAGKGADDTFWCEKAMAYKTNVIISNGTVWGNVYGGGEIGRVENNSVVMVGLEKVADGTSTYCTKDDGTDVGSVLAAGTNVVGKYLRSGVEGSYVYTLIGETSAPDIVGSVFGAGAGVETHGYSALVRGNTTQVRHTQLLLQAIR